MLYVYRSSASGGIIHYYSDMSCVFYSSPIYTLGELPKPAAANGAYAYFDTTITVAMAIEYQRTYTHLVYMYAKHTVVISCYDDPSKALDHITTTPVEFINMALKKLELPLAKEEKRLPITKDNKRVVTNASPAVQYISRILRECPKVTVTKPKLCSVKQYISKERKLIKHMKQSLYMHNIHDVIDRLELISSNVDWLRLALNDNKQTTEDWYYPVTQEQYNALSVYQSYTPHFKSCQYAALHELTLATAEHIVNHAHKYTPLSSSAIDSITTESFEYKQMSDFSKGCCDRFFQLDDNGYVLKRFAIYYDNWGRQFIDNFYNTSSRADLLIGNVLVTSVESFSILNSEYSTYKNGDRRAMKVAKVMQE